MLQEQASERDLIDQFLAALRSLPEVQAELESAGDRLAWLRALPAPLRLREAYGVSGEVTSDSGHAVALLQALLSLNLMSFFLPAGLPGSSLQSALMHRIRKARQALVITS